MLWKLLGSDVLHENSFILSTLAPKRLLGCFDVPLLTKLLRYKMTMFAEKKCLKANQANLRYNLAQCAASFYWKTVIYDALSQNEKSSSFHRLISFWCKCLFDLILWSFLFLKNFVFFYDNSFGQVCLIISKKMTHQFKTPKRHYIQS